MRSGRNQLILLLSGRTVLLTNENRVDILKQPGNLCFITRRNGTNFGKIFDFQKLFRKALTIFRKLSGNLRKSIT